MVVIGITGSMGTGKSTAAGMFAGLGAKVIDADRICHELLNSCDRIHKEITGIFGEEVLGVDGHISRSKLAEIVFVKKPLMLEALNSVIHPEAIKAIIAETQKARQEKFPAVVIDAPLLFESGFGEICDMVIVVDARSEIQKKRILMKKKFSETQIKGRMSSQYSLAEKKKKADCIIDNSGSLETTRRQVEKIWRKIK